MSDITVERSASGVSVGPLREQVRGRVLTGDDAGYDEVRAVHNGMFSKWPLAVLRAEQVADVIAGVNFARDNGLELSIRNGGHSGPGFGTNDSGPLPIIEDSGAQNANFPKTAISCCCCSSHDRVDCGNGVAGRACGHRLDWTKQQ